MTFLSGGAAKVDRAFSETTHDQGLDWWNDQLSHQS